MTIEAEAAQDELEKKARKSAEAAEAAQKRADKICAALDALDDKLDVVNSTCVKIKKLRQQCEAAGERLERLSNNHPTQRGQRGPIPIRR